DGFNGDGYGIGARGIGNMIGQWLDILDAELDLPIAGWLADSVDRKKSKSKKPFAWARQSKGLAFSANKKRLEPKKLPQSRAFRDVGVVNMHRSLLDAKNDLHLALRSSPYGTFGHNLANHNAFNIVYQGNYLFVPHGHRHGGAKNSAACYRHTRGHNSILIDGTGQPFSPEAYGWIARFLDGEKISYTCGDASNAYDAAPFKREKGAFEKAGLNIDDHISRGTLKRFRRHALFLRPSLIIIYDELEANKAVQWDWVLHCRKMMKADGSLLSVEGIDATVDVRGSTPLKAEVKTKPMFMPINIDGRGSKNAGSSYPVIGSHALVSTKEKTAKLRLLSIIQIGEQHKLIENSDGTLSCGEWRFQAQMDPAKLANLIVRNTDKTAQFILKTEDKGGSVLTEITQGQYNIQRCVDELPYAMQGLEKKENIIQ
ncbi:MAG: heparinase II/III family protein, partial [Lentisphaeraceae bacterium]|nr:heparinase II/III family protein [Lentisphaeraceae bacterium]